MGIRAAFVFAGLVLGACGTAATKGGESSASSASSTTGSSSSTGGSSPGATSASQAATSTSTSSGAEASSSGVASSGSGSSGSSTSSGGTGGSTVDGGCSIEGVPGTCIETSACSAMANHISTSGLCPGPADIECCTPYGEALCDPSAMPRPQPNASNITEAPGEGGCPAGMIAVTTFCIDKYEATLVQVANGEAWCPFDNPGTTMVKAISVAGAVPQAYISQIEAGDACANAGKRLCTDDEWLRACQGPTGTTYPYGNTDELGVCNDHRDEHPAVEYYGTTSSTIYTMLDNSCLDQIPETVDPGGSRTGCVTAEGAFDMMGNVHEWTANTGGTFRGGYFVDTTENGPGCLYATTAHDTSYWDYSTGFRCCAD